MADQVPPQNPPAPAPATPATQPETVTAQATTAVETGFKSVVKDLWGKYGIFFIIVGGLLLFAKFNDIIMDVLGWSSKKDLTDAQKTDSQLLAKENAANQQADALVKQANELPAQEGQVDVDWNKKK